MQDINLTDSEGLNIDSTLEQISKELKTDETLILDIDSSNLQQTDIIYDTLVLRGYNVIKNFKKGKNQIIVSRSKR